jgi:hypothetical protein
MSLVNPNAEELSVNRHWQLAGKHKIGMMRRPLLLSDQKRPFMRLSVGVTLTHKRLPASMYSVIDYT